MQFGILVALKIGIIGLIGSYAHYAKFGYMNWTSQTLIWFLAINFWICFWELALFYCYDSNMKLHNARTKAGFYKNDAEGRKLRANTPLVFFRNMSWKEAFSTETVASIWVDYGRFDPSYNDKHTFGYNIDVGNGHSTLVVTTFLFFSLFFPIFSAKVTGIIGILAYYQKWYGTLIYLFSFFNCGRYKNITWLELSLAVFATNGVWFTVPIMGFLAHIDMIMNETFASIF